jgi:hypothetical protein
LFMQMNKGILSLKKPVSYSLCPKKDYIYLFLHQISIAIPNHYPTTKQQKYEPCSSPCTPISLKVQHQLHPMTCKLSLTPDAYAVFLLTKAISLDQFSQCKTLNCERKLLQLKGCRCSGQAVVWMFLSEFHQKVHI